MIEKAIPTNVITGFLGSGKTTLIHHLLNNKPDNERWAVLVNEFGEVGIDGALIKGQSNDQVFIREVPGGCMCCTSGLPMQIALNQLIARAKPDRLLIEPTGLGHPKEVMDSLSATHYQDVLALQATLTLVDGRKLTDQRYREHAGFQEQIQVADIVVGSKADLYDENTMEHLVHYLAHIGCEDKPVHAISNGNIEASLLDLPSKAYAPAPRDSHHSHGTASNLSQQVAEIGFASVENKGEGYVSKGWIFNPQCVFDYERIFHLVHSIEVERIKGVVITENGIFGFNKADDVVSMQELDESDDSRIEVIHTDDASFAELDKLLKHAQKETAP